MFRLPRRIIHLPALAALLSLAGVSQAPAPGEARIVSIRFWSWGDVTRIAIETKGEYKLQSDQLESPPRLYFDLIGLLPTEPTHRKQQVIPVQDRLIKQIRVAETAPDVTRIVFDLQAPVEFSSSQLAFPDRLIVEVRAKGSKPSAEPNTERTVSGVQRIDNDAAEPQPAVAAIIPPPQAPRTRAFRAPPPLTYQNPIAGRTLAPDLSFTPPPPALPYLVPQQSPALRALLYGPIDRIHLEPPHGTSAKAARNTKAEIAKQRLDAPRYLPLNSAETSVTRPVAEPSVARSTTSTSQPLGSGALSRTDRSSETEPAARDSQGDRSLVRVFGLKVGKVVIDPGHGGKDTGTIGRHGLLEKDLVLDVALRLGKLIESRMGSEVVYTRTDDTFVPLEQRTQLALSEKADLFISIHANSSPYPSATGVETYYFNFTTEKAALDLATRENATATSSIHDLSDMLQRAVLKTKVVESREFAQKVQTSLQAMSVRMNSRSRDRGVRKAPFVVLIGATMPSILAEVGFVSNPHDEALLKRGEQREKIAEALLKGIAQYANTLSHVQMAKANVTE